MMKTVMIMRITVTTATATPMMTAVSTPPEEKEEVKKLAHFNRLR